MMLPGSETREDGHSARVLVRNLSGTTIGFRYFKNQAEALRSKPAFVRAGMYIMVQYWHVREHIWIG